MLVCWTVSFLSFSFSQSVYKVYPSWALGDNWRDNTTLFLGQTIVAFLHTNFISETPFWLRGDQHFLYLRLSLRSPWATHQLIYPDRFSPLLSNLFHYPSDPLLYPLPLCPLPFPAQCNSFGPTMPERGGLQAYFRFLKRTPTAFSEDSYVFCEINRQRVPLLGDTNYYHY